MIGQVIFIVVWDGESDLRFLVRTDWRILVCQEDQDYIQAIIEDSTDRAKLNPARTFKQFSSLGIGPLITRDVGSRIQDHPLLPDFCSCFVPV